ncbi:DUF892 family protein [Mucilaginibacter lutimaris]|uniref:DUF892 family protein n=1 Tax=Mucilaginibacter lutimaris TaxID=931629 RepID=A0ABW2ZGT7_9SPHI
MKAATSQMRVLDSHRLMNEQSIRKVFLNSLDNIYCIKEYLVDNLPIVANSASFKNLKNAILESVDEVKEQVARLKSVFALLNEEHKPSHCLGLKAYLVEAYRASKQPGLTDSESDFIILYHLKVLEGMEIVSYNNLFEMAGTMRNRELGILLKQNLDMAKDNKELYDMISTEYLA